MPKSTIPKPFARRLQHYREAAGLSVAQLAIRAVLSRMAIHRYESGERVPPLDVALRLCRALKIDGGAFGGCTFDAESPQE